MKELIIKRHVKSYEIRGLIIKEYPLLALNASVIELSNLKVDGRQRRFLTPEAIHLAELNPEPVKFCLHTVVRSEHVGELFNLNPSMIATLQGDGFEVDAFIDSILTIGEYRGISCVEIGLTPASAIRY